MTQPTLSCQSTLSPEETKALLDKIYNIPCVGSFGLEIEALAAGECQMRMPHNKAFNGIFDSFHGGLLMAAADMAACFAVMTLSGHQQVMATTDMNIRMLAPCLTDVRAKAKVIKFGRSLCPSHVDLYDMNDKLVAVAQATYMRLEALPKR